jgi:hypothetical protein
MNIKNRVQRPFQRGSCKKCHADPYNRAVTLCSACEAFVSQDFRSQKLRLVSNQELNRLSDELVLQQLGVEFEQPGDCINSQRKLERVLEKARLTSRQKQITNRFFNQGESFLKISASLGISAGCASKHLERAVKRLKKCIKPAIFMRGKEFSNSNSQTVGEIFRPRHRRLKSFNLENLKERRRQNRLLTLPQRFTIGKICPRCKDRIFRADQNYLYCMNCFWNSDQEN